MQRLALLAAFAGGLAGAATMDDPSIVYSPYTWHVTSGAAATVNSGAYFRVLFTGTSVAVSAAPANGNYSPSRFVVRVDGASWAEYSLTSGLVTASVSSLENRHHLLELLVKSTSALDGTSSRWSANAKSMLAVTGITLDSGATLLPTPRQRYNLLVYGDSITEGWAAHGYIGDYVADMLASYVYQAAQSLDAEAGIVAFAGQGITVPCGDVPALTGSYNYLYAGMPRNLASPAPDLVIFNEGYNDAKADVAQPLTSILAAIRLAAPDARFLLLETLNGSHAADLLAAQRNIGYGVYYQDTTGWFNPADSVDGVHPYDYAHLVDLAPRLIASIGRLLIGAPLFEVRKK